MRGPSIVILGISLVGSPIAVAGPPAVDGVFDEWTAATLIATDPLGDAANVFDVTEVHALNQGGELFVHFDTTTLLNIQSGPAEDGTLRLEQTFSLIQRIWIGRRIVDGAGDDGHELFENVCSRRLGDDAACRKRQRSGSSSGRRWAV